MLEISPVGDTALRIVMGDNISPEVHEAIYSFTYLLEKENLPGLIECVPTYVAITVFYDPIKISYKELSNKIEELFHSQKAIELPPSELIHIPTYYGDEAGPDLPTVAEMNNLRISDVIDIHSNKEYLIYMIGFTPGFPYLGGMSKKIAAPRLEVPRLKIPPGSVGIAGEQTGIYPMETPGGWQLIGRTPVRLYDPYRTVPIILKAGHYIKFNPISKQEYESIEREVKEGTYKVKREVIIKGGNTPCSKWI